LFLSSAGIAQTGNVYAIGLDGGESFGVNDGNNALDVSTQWTFEAWINVGSHVASNYECIMDRRTVFSFYLVDDDDNDYAITFCARNTSDVIIASVDCDGSGSISTNMTYDTWYHVAATFDGTTAKLYVNGTECDSDTDADWPLTASTNALNIGGRYWSGYSRQMSDAEIDEIRVSDIARDIATMQSNASWEEYTSDANTILLMHLNNSSVPPDYIPETGLNGSSFDDGITSIDYISPSDNLLRPNYKSKATGNWDAPATWSFYNGSSWSDASLVPGDYTPEVNILGGFTVTEASNLTTNSNTTLTIEDDGNLTVSGNLTNDGTLTVQSNADGTGSIIIDNAANATVQRYIVGHDNVDAAGWHLLGSPVAAFDIDGSPFDPGDDPSPNDLYRWEETTGYWMNYKNGDPTQIIPGTGYFTAWETTATKEFTGTLNIADISVTGLTNTAASGNSGWHLLGNPFASALKWNDGNWALSANVNGTAKIWNSTGPSYTDIEADGIIPSGNGFMVYVSADASSLTIPKASRLHDEAAWYKSTGSSLKFVATDIENNSFQEHNISLNQEATDGFDMPFDSYFLAGYAPKFYSVVNEQKLSTNSLPDFNAEREILLGFEKTEASQYSIELNTEDLMPGLDVFLSDLKIGTVQDMVANPVYLLTANEGDDPNRFKLGFAETNAIAAPAPASQFSTFVQNGTIHIKGIEALDGEVHLLDISGRMVATAALQNGNCELKANRPTGIYLVRIITEKGLTTKKIFIQ